MGFWSWLTGGGEKAQSKAPVPELVLLTAKPLVVEVPFIQGAIQHALGVSLPSGQEDAIEFITGQWPFFFFQFGGRLMQIKLAGHRYFDPVSRPFVSGDPEALLEKARARGLGEVIERHRAWIGVTYMSLPATASEDPYFFVAKMLGAFAVADVLAVIDPGRCLIEGWNEEMRETLEAGKYQPLFRS